MKVHPQFKLNSIAHTQETLHLLAMDWSKHEMGIEKDIGKFILEWLSSSGSITVHTSGSTGTPKAIVLRKAYMCNSARATGNYFDLRPGDSALLCLPIAYIAGKMMLVRAMVLGLHITIVAPSSAPLEATKEPYDFVAMVPLQAKNSLSQLERVHTLIVGGGAIPTALRQALEKVDTNIYETYGMTETITHIALKRFTAGTRPMKDYFETLPGVGISQDQRGCLVINAPSISDTEVVTNDLVELKDGRRFKWLGRYDTIINSGGIKLVPEQLEEKLAPIINSRFFVHGVPDELLGTRLVLVVEGLPVLNFKDKVATLAGLERYEIPKAIYFVPQFKETETGKVHRKNTMALIDV